MEIILAGKVLFGTWFVTHFSPFEEGLMKVCEWGETRVPPVIIHSIYSLGTCWKCQSFWVSILVVQNFWWACAVSFLAWGIEKIMDYGKK